MDKRKSLNFKEVLVIRELFYLENFTKKHLSKIFCVSYSTVLNALSFKKITFGANMKKRMVAEFDGGHARLGEIWIQCGECTLCKKVKIVIGSDGSEGEYKNALLCAECVENECRKGFKERP